MISSTMSVPTSALIDRALAAAEADAAEHRGRQRGDLEADADVAAGGRQPRREEDAAERREHARRRRS